MIADGRPVVGAIRDEDGGELDETAPGPRPGSDWSVPEVAEAARAGGEPGLLLAEMRDEDPGTYAGGVTELLRGAIVNGRLLRACLRPSSIERTVATQAVRLLSRDPTIDIRATEVEREAVAGIKRLEPGRRELSDPEWRRLCICCLVLARFEQHFRAGRCSSSGTSCPGRKSV